MVDIGDKRAKILEYLREVGPALPVKISKIVEMEPLFVSAILNEMVGDGLIKLSDMKRGASRFYFLPGQEERLCEFAEEDLGGDRPAYVLLKNKKYLKDSEQEPQIRVSLRKIKDFAIPFTHDNELYWKFTFVPNSEIEEILEGKNDSKEKVVEKEKEEIVNESVEDISNEEVIEAEEEDENKELEEIFDTAEDTDKEEKKEKKEITEEEKSEILLDVEKYLKKKGKVLKEIFEFNKNEAIGVVDIETDLGNVSYLVIAKSKKTFNDADVLLVNDRASREKMPLYLLLKGKLTKKAEKLIEDYKNLIVVENF